MRPNDAVRVLSGAPLVWRFLKDDGSPALTIHRTFCRQCWVEDGYRGAFLMMGGALLMLPTLAVVAGLYTWRCGKRVKREVGKGFLRQMREQLTIGCRLAVPPPWYYMFELYRDDHRRRAIEYLYRTEMKRGMYNMLRKRRSSQASTNALRDKALFATRCADAGVAVVDAMATVTGGRIECKDGSSELPRCDLFFKPISGAGGRGASRWVYEGDDQYRSSEGNRVSVTELEAHVRELSLEQRYVVRRYVRNHPEIAELSPGVLSTVRVVTCLDEKGRPEITHAVLRMARSKDVVVDNFHVGGIAAEVNIATGTLGLATDMGLRADSGWWSQHPTTGAMIEGRRLPYWDAVLSLAERGHQAFDDQVAIGWDIAILPDGPQMIEGNKSPDLDIIQRVGRAPVGNARLGELLAFHVEQAFPA